MNGVEQQKTWFQLTKKKKGGYTLEEYLNLEKNCGVKCGKCNFMEFKGYKICPLCKIGYYKPKRNRDKTCWNCFVLTPIGKKIKEYRDTPQKLLKLEGGEQNDEIRDTKM